MAKSAHVSGRWRRWGAVFIGVGVAWHVPVSLAVTLFQKSLFTVIDPKVCKTISVHQDGNTYLCPGLDGFPVYLAVGDGRTYVAASSDPEKSQAASQSLHAFNTPFPVDRERATVEWRFTIKNKRQVPFAMIVRYFTHSDDRHGEVLVVTRIAGRDACHVAYIDALANPEAIVVARRIADDRARTFDCHNAATIEGESGVSPM